MRHISGKWGGRWGAWEMPNFPGFQRGLKSTIYCSMLLGVFNCLRLKYLVATKIREKEAVPWPKRRRGTGSKLQQTAPFIGLFVSLCVGFKRWDGDNDGDNVTTTTMTGCCKESNVPRAFESKWEYPIDRKVPKGLLRLFYNYQMVLIYHFLAHFFHFLLFGIQLYFHFHSFKR